MNSPVVVVLHTDPQQFQSLVQLQAGFAAVCNAMTATVQAQRLWNRVALHHLLYRSLREQFPAMGSQMICNAIYSVSKTCRVLFQHPQSPFSLANLGERALPRLQFSENCPVYFDRHTLSIRGGRLSMFTLDGRLKFDLSLQPEVESRFMNEKLKEIVLARQGEHFALTFMFGEAADEEGAQLRLDVPEAVMPYVQVENAL